MCALLFPKIGVFVVDLPISRGPSAVQLLEVEAVLLSRWYGFVSTGQIVLWAGIVGVESQWFWEVVVVVV